jgi:bla regulator protein BlaR1
MLAWSRLTLAAAGIAALAAPIAVGVMNAPVIRAQSAAGATPKFEVASIRFCADEAGGRGGRGSESPGRLTIGCQPLVDTDYLGLIQQAYVRFANGRFNLLGVVPIEGGPAWIHSERYEINAKAEGPASEAMMHGPMLQALLEDRFKLKIRREVKEGPVYELALGKAGSKLQPLREGSCVVMQPVFPIPAPEPGQKYCKVLVSPRSPQIVAEGSTIGDFCKLLDLVLDRPVIDRTGLSARFDIRLEFSREVGMAKNFGADSPGASDPAAAPTVFTAIQEQLGLKLVPAKGPVEHLVIDRVERPSAN